MGLIKNVLEEGFIYGIMAMGVTVSYSILKFPDLSVDGTFPLGACITAVLILAGVNPWLACAAAFLCGAAAGCVTGLLHVKLRITDLLSGILVMTAMWSVNLVITGGSAVKPFYNMPTIFNSGIASMLPKGIYTYRILIIAFVAALVVKLLLDRYLRTKSGLILQATGDNTRFVTSLAINPGRMKILGLAIGNGLTALSGSILAQQGEYANISSGTGMVVMGLASVIIGTSLLKRVSFLKLTTMAVLGSIAYKACLVAAMKLGLPTNYLKLLMAVLLTVALVSNGVLKRGKEAQLDESIG
ncbi:putative ABC transport system permease protein [Papillibacter cinnamivorans DSM 12816]|uniref:Putative ABC transport system permease protein n=1 Tax=Papillibacter cinnamivorans DSM 12816 TaxID=1122930 RepID=A0A1W1ZHH5_9FIRM|nr:putative ABC transport system permease protein [Papillibacter cinnamivorans DSM 12816]